MERKATGAGSDNCGEKLCDTEREGTKAGFPPVSGSKQAENTSCGTRERGLKTRSARTPKTKKLNRIINNDVRETSQSVFGYPRGECLTGLSLQGTYLIYLVKVKVT